MPSAAAPFAPVFDLYRAVPEAGPARDAALAGDWAAVRAVFDAIEDPQTRVAASVAVADLPRIDRLLKPAVEAGGDGPGSVLPRTLLAHHHINVGWAIRTGHFAEHVSADRFRRFHQHLHQAEQLLHHALRLDPQAVLARHLGLMTSRGLQLGQTETRRRYDRLAADSPDHFAAQHQVLQQLCPKWGGSWRAVDDFARECREQAPPGGLGAVIGVEAQLERWMAAGRSARLVQWRRPSVRASLVAAAEASVLHPAHRPGGARVNVHSVFAAAFSLAGMHRHAHRHFEELGGFSSRYPWESLYALPAAELIRHRAAAPAAAGRRGGGA